MNMNAMNRQAMTERAVQLSRLALSRPRSPFKTLPERVLLVDVNLQRATFLEGGAPVAEYRVSTSSIGVGGEDGSNRTPPGWHRVHSRIGAGAEPGTVFESREPTGRIWKGEPSSSDLILSRIIRLEGLEPAVNQGAGCDSCERYIYIHGTNHEAQLGRPASHGCVRMSNDDVRDLFDRLFEGDAVVIIEEGLRERA